ncbi:EamA-like transporter family protein [Sphingomonas guangdongensis]|uniref:EamA-like transporter family protein n=1 Tax=Sphingomonas guangdongensis TaxID=1141890 RepID=A0A285QGH9_9SPHN|nr:DMT family transporter [Sphingomonas guangdongensis]SOB80618.1 EamA-like transporter family protein [Sphingomonas guangdongensis]
MNRDVRAYAMLACVMLFWAGNAVAGRALRDAVPPFTLSLLRWAGALALLLPFAWAHLRADRAGLRAHWRRLLLLGLVGVASFNAFNYLGLHYTTASNALLLGALSPACVLAADRVLFGVRPAPVALIGVAIAVAGVVVIVFRGDPAAVAGLRLGRGDLLILIGILLWAVYTSLLRTKPAIHPFSFLAATFAVAVAAMLPLAAWEWAAGERVHLTAGALAGIAYVAVLPSLVAYHLFNQAVATVGPGRAGQAINLLPLFGALLAAALLGEQLHGYHIAGMLLILAGLAIGLAARPAARA